MLQNITKKVSTIAAIAQMDWTLDQVSSIGFLITCSLDFSKPFNNDGFPQFWKCENDIFHDFSCWIGIDSPILKIFKNQKPKLLRII